VNQLLKYLRIKESFTGFTVRLEVSNIVPMDDRPSSNLSVIYANREYILYEQYGCLTIRNKRWKENIALRKGILDNDKIFNEDNIRYGLLDFIEELIEESDKARILEELRK